METTVEVAVDNEDPRIGEYRRLRAMGLPRPKGAPVDLWTAAGPYTEAVNAMQSTREQLDQRVIDKAAEPLPKDEKQLLKHFFPQAVAARVDIMNNPQAKDNDRINASSIFVDHTVGKPDQNVHVSGSLALEVHNQLEKLCKDIRSGTVIDSANLLAKPKTAVDNFLEKRGIGNFIVGRKVAPVVQPQEQLTAPEGLPQGTNGEAEGL